MYDSTTAGDIPANAAMVAGYINGTYCWSAADWARFPNAVKVRISVNAQTDDGQVLDVEQGDAYPHEAPGWVALRRAAGVDPTVYCNRANVDAVRSAFLAANMPLPHLWLAAYDGLNGVPDGYVAKQYADQAMIPGQPHYDLSAVLDFWPGVDGGTMFKDDPDAQAFAMDVHDSLEAIKTVLGTQAHHTHVYAATGTAVLTVGGKTSESLTPPVPGAAYFSSDDSLSIIGWTFPDKTIHFFQRGTEIVK